MGKKKGRERRGTGKNRDKKTEEIEEIGREGKCKSNNCEKARKGDRTVR